MKKFATITSILLLAPFVAFAQNYFTPIQQMIVSIGNIVALLIPISIGLTMLAFFYGLFKYVKDGAKAGGQQIMIGGLGALFIMVSVWGIIRLAQGTLNVDPTNTVNAPHFPQN